jgi:peptidoglycan biosynthesis protein MviN/MurJ (putative lipid II flippase)
MVLRVPLVRLFFGLIPGTQLTLDQTYQVAWILLWFSFGLIFITSRWFVFSLFYASKDTLMPSIISTVSLFSVIGLSVVFTNLFSHNTDYAISSINWSLYNLTHRAENAHQAGVGGISLAMSIVYTIEFFILIVLFNKYKFNIGLRKLAHSITAKFIAGAAMMTFIYFTYKIWNVLTYTIPEMASIEYRGSTTINLFLLTTITVIPGFMIYFLICHLLRVEELKIFKKYLNPVFRLGGLKIKEPEQPLPINPV